MSKCLLCIETAAVRYINEQPLRLCFGHWDAFNDSGEARRAIALLGSLGEQSDGIEREQRADLAFVDWIRRSEAETRNGVNP